MTKLCPSLYTLVGRGLAGLCLIYPSWAWSAAPIDREAVSTTLYVHDLSTQTTRAARTEPRRLAAPSWSPDGTYWLVNNGGSLVRVPTTGGDPLSPVGLAASGWIDVDHGIAPDGRTLAVTGSDHLAFAPADGGAATRLVEAGGSYFHSWSPDGLTVYFSAWRNNNLDLYAVKRAGGPERRLTTDRAADDTAAASADGRWIYFASNRSGRMKIWRIPPGGTDAQAEQVTFDDRDDDAPHPSPDGKWLIYQAERSGPGSYLPDHETTIRKLALPGLGVKLDAPTAASGTEEVARFVGRHKSLGRVSLVARRPPVRLRRLRPAAAPGLGRLLHPARAGRTPRRRRPSDRRGRRRRAVSSSRG